VLARGGFKSGYSASQEDDCRGANVNIIRGAKPTCWPSFSINREGGSGGLNMTEVEGNALINIGDVGRDGEISLRSRYNPHLHPGGAALPTHGRPAVLHSLHTHAAVDMLAIHGLYLLCWAI
jgi:hypothetical protein